MFTIHGGLAGHGGLDTRRAAKARRLAAVIGALIIASLAVNALIILADGRLHHGDPPAASLFSPR